MPFLGKLRENISILLQTKDGRVHAYVEPANASAGSRYALLQTIAIYVHLLVVFLGHIFDI